MKQEHYRFVTEYLRWGDEVIAYKNAYNATENYQTLEPLAATLLRHPEVAGAIGDARAAMRRQLEHEEAEQQQGELLTLRRKRELLCKIATGDIMVEQNYKGKDCNVCTQFVRPTINQMLRAIHLDSKLANHYPQPVIARQYLPRQVRTKQSHETPVRETSSFEQGREEVNARSKTEQALPAGEKQASKQKNIQNHNKSQQIVPSVKSDTKANMTRVNEKEGKLAVLSG